MNTPPGIRCSVCGGTFVGYHSCGGAKPMSNLPDVKWTIVDREAERRELARLREENQRLRDLLNPPLTSGTYPLHSGDTPLVPREEPQPAPAECADCGAPMNGGEAATFTVCSTCWDRHYRPAPSGEALKALDEVVTTIQFHHERGGRWGIALTNLALVRRALSGLPQPTPEEVAWLIERDGGGVALWWTGDGSRPWSPEHAEAVRFARQRDAELVITGNAPLYRHSEREGFNIFLGAKATEHAWFAPTSPPTPTGEADRT